MYPDQQQSPYQPQNGGIEYLNQISPQNSSNGFSPKQKWLVIILGIMVVAIGGMALFAATRPNTEEGAVDMTTSIFALGPIVEEAQENIQDSRLATTNSTLRAYLQNAVSTLSSPDSGAAIDAEALQSTIDDANPLASMQEKFEDARLSGTYDRVYTREMVYQLQSISIQMQSIQDETGSDTYRQTLADLEASLAPLLEDIEEVSAEIN